MAKNPAQVAQNAVSDLVRKNLGEKVASLAGLFKYQPSDPIAQRIIAGGLATGFVAVGGAAAYVLIKHGGIKIIIETAKDEVG